MIDSELLSAEHAQIDAIAVELLAIIAGSDAPGEKLASLRWRLNRHLLVHLAREDSHVYPLLVKAADIRLARLASAFQAEMGGLAQDYLAYNAQWDAAAVAKDWPGFCAATRHIMNALRRRIRREERDLYPMIATAPDQLAANG
ncbi:MAG: hemerythrin domain-containing protein [Sphingomonas sp.]